VAGKLGTMLREQPILAGCLGVVALGVLLLCGGGALLFVGGRALVQKASDSAGLDGVMSIAREAGEAGFMFSVAMDDRGTVYSLAPTGPRTVTCDDAKAILFPHLTGTLETVQVESESILENPDGSYTTVPLRCTWGGWPGKDGQGGVLQPEAPATGLRATPPPTASDSPSSAEPSPAEPSPASDAGPSSPR